LVSFLPLNLTDPDSLETVISHIDYTMQYGEDEEPKEVGLINLFQASLQPLWLCYSPMTWMRVTSRTWNKNLLMSDHIESSTLVARSLCKGFVVMGHAPTPTYISYLVLCDRL
jgi:hypothetical protein